MLLLPIVHKPAPWSICSQNEFALCFHPLWRNIQDQQRMVKSPPQDVPYFCCISFNHPLSWSKASIQSLIDKTFPSPIISLSKRFPFKLYFSHIHIIYKIPKVLKTTFWFGPPFFLLIWISGIIEIPSHYPLATPVLAHVFQPIPLFFLFSSICASMYKYYLNIFFAHSFLSSLLNKNLTFEST